MSAGVLEVARASKRAGTRTDLVDDFVPFLAAYSDLNSLIHEAGRNDDAMKFVGDAPGGFGDWRRHLWWF